MHGITSISRKQFNKSNYWERAKNSLISPKKYPGFLKIRSSVFSESHKTTSGQKIRID